MGEGEWQGKWLLAVLCWFLVLCTLQLGWFKLTLISFDNFSKFISHSLACSSTRSVLFQDHLCESKVNSILFLRNHLVCCVDEVSFVSVNTNLASSVNFYKDCTGVCVYKQVSKRKGIWWPFQQSTLWSTQWECYPGYPLTLPLTMLISPNFPLCLPNCISLCFLWLSATLYHLPEE